MQTFIKYTTIIFLLAFAQIELQSQSPIGELLSVKVNQQNDTIILNRTYGDWWFGLMSGANYSLYFSELIVTENNIQSVFFDETTYDGGIGSGFFLGTMVEYTPAGKDLGWGVRALFDIRRGQTDTSPDENDEFERFNSVLGYINLSPYGRYNFWGGLHFFGGVDIDLLVYQDSKHRQIKLANLTENVIDQFVINLEESQFRVGANAGLGYDIYFVDINKNSRLRITPFVSAHFGSPLIRDNNSSWNSLMLRAGIQGKFGPDEITYDTLKFDPEYVVPPIYLATAQIESGVEFPGFRPQEFVSADLSYNPEELFVEELTFKAAEKPRQDTLREEAADIAEVSESNTTALEEGTEDIAVQLPENIPNIPETPEIQFNVGETDRFSFQTSASSALSNELKQYLDRLAEFLKENPSFEVAIVGHSDNTGTIDQNTQRSQQRALNVVEYLMSKNIPRRRLLNSGAGSVRPIAPNNTEAGRRANRRVEITIRQ